MPVGIVNPGYMGFAIWGDNTKFRFTDSNIAAKQDINAPDLVTGHWNRQAYNYGPVEINGTISGPVGENFTAAETGMWNKATKRGNCGQLDEASLTINYFCATNNEDPARFTYSKAKVNSLTFSCAAGEVAQFSMDMIMADPTGITHATNTDTWGTDPEKLITWDQVHLACTPGTVSGSSTQSFSSELFSNFEVTFGNNVTAVYALGQDNLFPYALVDGITTITGSVSAYNIPEMFGANKWGEYTASGVGTINFSVGAGIPVALNVQWHRVEPTSSVGPIISTVAFTGVTTQPVI